MVKLLTKVLIYTVGYESRSAHAANTLTYDYSLAIVVSQKRELDFDNNLSQAESRGSQLIEQDGLPVNLEEALDQIFRDKITDDLPNVIVDVSSMSRDIISIILSKCYLLLKNEKINLKIVYCEGQYQAPRVSSCPYLDLGAIHRLEGWSLYPERPLALIVGLGYEEDLAAASIEYLDPSGIWTFIADGRDERFKVDVLRNNDSLLRLVPEKEFLTYQPHAPYRLYSELRSLAEALANQARVIIVCGGPKIFSAIAILVKLCIGDEVAVWRVSAHDYEPIRDTKASGEIVEFEFKI